MRLNVTYDSLFNANTSRARRLHTGMDRHHSTGRGGNLLYCQGTLSPPRAHCAELASLVFSQTGGGVGGGGGVVVVV